MRYQDNTLTPDYLFYQSRFVKQILCTFHDNNFIRTRPSARHKKPIAATRVKICTSETLQKIVPPQQQDVSEYNTPLPGKPEE